MVNNEINKEIIDEVFFELLKNIYLFQRKEAALFKVTWDEIYMLQLLSRQQGIQVSVLSRQLKMQDFVTSRMITKLAKDGFVVRKTSEIDRRAVLVYITERGKAKLEEIQEYNFKTIYSHYDKLPAEDIRVLINSVDKLGELLGLE